MSTSNLDADIDALFALPLAEFITARNALAGRLKREGRRDESDRVKAMIKPSITAWAVNQLYWKNGEAFQRLIEAGQRFREAQASKLGEKSRDMGAAVQARRKTLSELSRLAAALLSAAGHNATSETIRRITTTLEAISAYASLPGAPSPGRLTEDLDAPSFEALAGLIAGENVKQQAERPAPVVVPDRGDAREAKITAAKVSLSDAEQVLNEARARVQRIDAELKTAVADVNEAEKHEREAEERFQQASVASKEARRRERSLAAEAQDAAKAVENAARLVEKTSRQLSIQLKR